MVTAVGFPSPEDLLKVRGVLLDLDNTLYPYQPCHERALAAAFRATDAFATFDEFQRAYAEARKRVAVDCATQGTSHSRFLYFQKLLEAKFGATRVGMTLKLHDEYWSAYRSELQPAEGVLEFLALCRQKGVRICILTDLTASLQFQKLEALKLEPWIDFVVSSEEAGVEKPHPYAFYLALEKLRLPAGEVVMVGDDAHKDGKGAGLLGIPYFEIAVRG